MKRVFISILFTIAVVTACRKIPQSDINHECDTIAVLGDRVADIMPPKGFFRVNYNDPFSRYLKALKIKSKSDSVRYYDGTLSGMRFFRVIDFPILNDDEQCADVIIHLRADYLLRTGQYHRIRFNNYSGYPMCYYEENNADRFNEYLKKTFKYANTYTLSKELKIVPFQDVRPGNVFIYTAEERGGNLGHVIIVLDVARNKEGKQIILAAQGFTPACDLHIIQNDENNRISPWIEIPTNDTITIAGFEFYSHNLMSF